MTIDELHTHYNQNWSQAAREIGICLTTLQNWRERGHIPAKWQAIVEKVTNGKLKARFEDVPNE